MPQEAGGGGGGGAFTEFLGEFTGENEHLLAPSRHRSSCPTAICVCKFEQTLVLFYVGLVLVLVLLYVGLVFWKGCLSYSQFSPCGHLAITDTPIIWTVVN